MQRTRQESFNWNDSIVEPITQIKYPKPNKIKLMKQLNNKAFVYQKSENCLKLNSNSKQKDHLIHKQRSRKNSSVEMQSLLQRAIPGAKITKGEWKDHKLNGDVIIQYDNGNLFQGKYQNGLRVQGKMIYADANCQYEGSYFAQKFSGYGKLTYYEGRVIQGQWDNLGLTGNATITYPNKDVYYGPVDEKLYKHGQGYLFLSNGYKYVGSFKKGSISGIGSYFKDQKLIKKGIWQKGKLIKQIVGSTQQTESEEQHSEMIFLKQSTTKHFRYKLNETTQKNSKISKQTQNRNKIDKTMKTSIINKRQIDSVMESQTRSIMDLRQRNKEIQLEMQNISSIH